MHEAWYYRDQAERLRRMARDTNNDQVSRELERLAIDFDDIAEDLELGAIEIIRPDLLPQRKRPPF
jgi:hypothetical protein